MENSEYAGKIKGDDQDLITEIINYIETNFTESAKSAIKSSSKLFIIYGSKKNDDLLPYIMNAEEHSAMFSTPINDSTAEILAHWMLISLTRNEPFENGDDFYNAFRAYGFDEQYIRQVHVYLRDRFKNVCVSKDAMKKPPT